MLKLFKNTSMFSHIHLFKSPVFKYYKSTTCGSDNTINLFIDRF